MSERPPASSLRDGGPLENCMYVCIFKSRRQPRFLIISIGSQRNYSQIEFSLVIGLIVISQKRKFISHSFFCTLR